MLIHDNLKSQVDKLEIYKLDKVPSGLSSLKRKIYELNIGKLKTTPTDLSNLSNSLKNEVFKKTEYDELVKKVNNAIDISKLVNKADYNAKIKDSH